MINVFWSLVDVTSSHIVYQLDLEPTNVFARRDTLAMDSTAKVSNIFVRVL